MFSFHNRFQAACCRLWQRTITPKERLFWESPPSREVPWPLRAWFVVKAIFIRVVIPELAWLLLVALLVAAIGAVLFYALLQAAK